MFFRFSASIRSSQRAMTPHSNGVCMNASNPVGATTAPLRTPLQQEVGVCLLIH